MKKMIKVLFAASEAVPFAKVGGLADVAGTMPSVMEKFGTDVRLVLPLYKSIDQNRFKMKTAGSPFTVTIAGEVHTVVVKTTKLPDTKQQAYFIQCDRYFDRDGIYDNNGQAYNDDDERFALFSKAVIEMIKIIDWKPDIIHCNDWHTGLIPTFLKVIYKDDPILKNVSSLLTIHNIAHQGVFPPQTMEKIELPWDVFTPEGVEYWGSLNYLKAGIVYADMLSTVSPSYSKQVQTSDEFGMGLEGLLKYRNADFIGILNGIDYNIWDPDKDQLIASNFNSSDLRGKARCKKALQKELELDSDNSPILGLINRLISQKGIDLIVESIDTLMEMGVQIAVLGTGEEHFHHSLKSAAEKYKGKISVTIGFDEELAHRIYSSSDIFLMPSKFEPCGLGQMIALKYGALPVVFKTGGLADTIIDYTDDPNRGNGFVMEEHTKEGLINTVRRALEIYSNKRKWNSIVKGCMEQDFSWDKSAALYLDLYKKVMEKHSPVNA